MEEWKPICCGYYEITCRGMVRRAMPGVNTHTGREKKTSVSANGYRIFGAFVYGKRTNILVHRAVAEAFIRPMLSGEVINHKDGNKLNNHVENLEIVTPKENAIHAYKNGLASPPTARATGDAHWTRRSPDHLARGDANGARKHPEKIKRGDQVKASKLRSDQVSTIKRYIREGKKLKEIAAEFGVSRKNINDIKNGKSWRHIQ